MTTNVATIGQWLELARLCAEASESRMYIDEVIWLALDAGVDLDHAERKAPKVTSSIDAITALIEQELPKAAWCTVRPLDDRKPSSKIQRRGETGFDIWVETEAATPALALCAAFCRAMSEKVSHDN